MKKYKVWFHQINQSFVEVNAKDYEEALEKAERKWRRDEGWPISSYIEVMNEDGKFVKA